MQVGGERSFQSLQTRIRPSEYCTKKRNSSEKTILRHSCVQLCRSMLQSHRHCVLKGSRSNGRRADSPNTY
ncbi:hypothetical protein TNCV_2678581 [Trichonephila clavipes]|nr:hypothetical protein TNCV_2678581 [Trichonephila clavipes]